MKKILSITLLLTLLVGCSNKGDDLQKFEGDFKAFDTYITMTGYTKTKSEFDDYLKIAEDEFVRLNQIFDKYNAYDGVTNIYAINEKAGQGPVEVGPEIMTLLKYSIDNYEVAHEAVNVNLGAVLEIYHTYREEGLANPSKAKIPPMADLEAAKKCTNINDVVLDETKNTVELKQKCNSLDVGATAKGYSTKLVVEKLKAAGLEHGLINSGGNVSVINDKPDGSDYVIGVANPEDPNSSIETVNVKDTNIVTSGDYQRFYEVDGVRMHHIIDPATLRPANKFRSTTIITQDGLAADFFSTASFIMDKDQTKKLADEYDFDVIFVDNDLKVEKYSHE